MISKTSIVPWDPKALKNEVTRIVRSFQAKEEIEKSVKAEQMMPAMKVTPWDRKALRRESKKIIAGCKERTYFLK